MSKTPKTFMAFRPDPDLARAMATLSARDGISTSEQIRRALRQWLKKKGVYQTTKTKKTAPLPFDNDKSATANARETADRNEAAAEKVRKALEGRVVTVTKAKRI